MGSRFAVIPAKAGIQCLGVDSGSPFHCARNDGAAGSWYPLAISVFTRMAIRFTVIPAKAGIQYLGLDSGSSFHCARNDEERAHCFLFRALPASRAWLASCGFRPPPEGPSPFLSTATKRDEKMPPRSSRCFLRFSARPGVGRRVHSRGQRRPSLTYPFGPDPVEPAMLRRAEGGTDTARRLCRCRQRYWAKPNTPSGRIPFTRAPVCPSPDPCRLIRPTTFTVEIRVRSPALDREGQRVGWR